MTAPRCSGPANVIPARLRPLPPRKTNHWISLPRIPVPGLFPYWPDGASSGRVDTPPAKQGSVCGQHRIQPVNSVATYEAVSIHPQPELATRSCCYFGFANIGAARPSSRTTFNFRSARAQRHPRLEPTYRYQKVIPDQGRFGQPCSYEDIEQTTELRVPFRSQIVRSVGRKNLLRLDLGTGPCILRSGFLPFRW